MRASAQSVLAALLLLAGGAGRAVTLSVTFDAALTNGTGWTYSDGFAYAKGQKAYGFSKKDAVVRSPDFGFDVTAAVVRAYLASDRTERTLWIVPTAAAEGATNLLRRLALPADGAVTNAVAAWSPEDRVSAVALYMDGTSGNVYVNSAVFAGVPKVAAPAAPANADVWRDRFTATWRNPPDAVADELDLFRETRVEASWNWVWQTDFAAFTNGQTTTEITERLRETYPGFGGTRLYAPKNTNGVIRIGSRDDAGVLTCTGIEECAGRHLVLRVWRDAAWEDEGWIAPVSWISGDATNALGSVSVGTAPAYVAVPLDGVPDGAVLAVHSSTNRSTSSRANGRLYVDRFGVAEAYAAGSVQTARVARVRFPAVARRRVRGLERDVRYEWAVRAVGAEGGVSPWSERVSVDADRPPTPGFAVRVR